MGAITIAIICITIIGAACAVILSVAAKVMYVAVDERIVKIQDALPGTNCGACGFPGCSGYANALIVDPSIKSNLCPPGGAEAIAKISEVLGIESEAAASKTAVVHCGGDGDAHVRKMEYRGIQTCYAAFAVFCGESACAYGCLGYGDCVAVCPVDAICLENGLARVNTNCTGCGLCVKVCPTQIISINDGGMKPVIACSNIEKAAAVRKKCTKCCYGCGVCVRKCPQKAIILENNLAKINYENCKNCNLCLDICPTKCIQLRN